MGNNQSRLSDSVDRKHTFIRRLGSGGFGTVSAVRNNASGKVVARKDIYWGAFLGVWYNREQLNAAANEVQMLKGIRHPNIVEFLGWENFTDQRTLSIYMECCDTSLSGLVADLSQRGQLIPGDLILHVSHSLLRALKFLHSPNPAILHRDIKPENVLINYRHPYLFHGPRKYPKVKLSDFGISTINQSSNGTRTWGTPGYMAPELITAINNRRSPVHTTASDMYAFGQTIAVMYNSSTMKGGEYTTFWKKTTVKLINSCVETEPSKRPSAVMASKWTAPLAPRRGFVWVRYWISTLSACYTLVWLPLRRVLFCPRGLWDTLSAVLSINGLFLFLALIVMAYLGVVFYGSQRFSTHHVSWTWFAIDLGLTYSIAKIMSFGQCRSRSLYSPDIYFA